MLKFMDVVARTDPTSSNSLAINIIFDFDEVWNRKSAELIADLGYKNNSIITDSKLISHYITNLVFARGAKLKALYQII